MNVNVGIIGTGWFAGTHAEILSRMDGVKVRAVCGSGMEKAERFAADWPDATAFASVEEMLDRIPLDAVYICVPPMAHGKIERLLIERGIPFFVEKPLATDLEVPSQILAELQRKPVITSVGYHFRYMESTTKAISLLKTMKTGSALGFWMGDMPKVPWWRKQEGSGGQFIEQTTHLVDLLRYTLGEIREVYAAYANRVMHEAEDGVTVADVGTVTLKLASGAIASISNTCILPMTEKIGLHIYTDRGVLRLGMNSLTEIGKDRTEEWRNTANPVVAENEAFIRAVRTGDASGILSPYEDAFKTQQVTVAALHSAALGQPVPL